MFFIITFHPHVENPNTRLLPHSLFETPTLCSYNQKSHTRLKVPLFSFHSSICPLILFHSSICLEVMTACRDGIVTMRSPLPYALGAMGTMAVAQVPLPNSIFSQYGNKGSTPSATAQELGEGQGNMLFPAQG